MESAVPSRGIPKSGFCREKSHMGDFVILYIHGTYVTANVLQTVHFIDPLASKLEKGRHRSHFLYIDSDNHVQMVAPSQFHGSNVSKPHFVTTIPCHPGISIMLTNLKTIERRSLNPNQSLWFNPT